MKNRIIASFSCGAASAVATKLAIEKFGDRVTVINIDVAEEHSDNRRFLADCEKWFGKTVVVLRDQKYGGSIETTFRKKRFIVGPRQTPCSLHLKKEVAYAYYRNDDEIVIGYTAEEEGRANRFIDANNDRVCHFPLIDAGLTKPDCLALIDRQGIQLPEMYRLGFDNANCIGCVRGGQAYWNKIKNVFPVQFEKMAALEEEIGAGILRYRSGHRKGERMPLRELQPTKNTVAEESNISCSIFCEMTEREWKREANGE